MLHRYDFQRQKTQTLISAWTIIGIALLIIVLFVFNIENFNILLLGTFGLGCMALAIYIVGVASRTPQASIGVWFVIVLALQHGGGWILEQIFGDQHYSRIIYYTDQDLALAVVLAGISLLVFASAYAYCMVSRRRKMKFSDCISPTRNNFIDQIPWFVLWAWVAGFIVFQFGGGFSSAIGNSGQAYVVRSIFGFLSGPLVILISIKILSAQFNFSRSFLLVTLTWLIYIVLVGQRQYIVAIALSTIVLTSKWNIVMIKTKHIFWILLFFVFITIGIAFLRDVYGRNLFLSSFSDRIAILSNESSYEWLDVREGLVYDLGYRLNAGNVLLGLVADQPVRDLLWLEPVTYSATKLVPGFIWMGKQDMVGELPLLIALRNNLPFTDYIATYVTVFYAIGGLPMLILLSAVFGALIALLDVKLAIDHGIFTIIFAIGIVGGVLSIDHSIDLLFLSIRNSLLLYVFFKIIVKIVNIIFNRSINHSISETKN